MIKRVPGAYLAVNIAPYTRDHLLVIPARHVTELNALSPREKKTLSGLVWLAAGLLRKRGHAAYSILARQGKKSGRSVKHVHIHVIPDLIVTNKERASARRPVMTDAACSRLVREYKKLIGT